VTVKQIPVPDIGSDAAVDVIEILVAVGDPVDIDTPLITLESEKASMDVPSTDTGIVESIAVQIGDKVNAGSVILNLRVEGEASTPEVSRAPEQSTTMALIIPDLGEASDVEIIEIHVKAGDTVAKDDPLVTLESEKAAMDVPAPSDGTVEQFTSKVGDKVSQGDVIGALLVRGDAVKAASLPAAKTPPQPASPPPMRHIPQPQRSDLPVADFSQVHAGPAVRRFARELGVDLTKVAGSGRKGRVVKSDVKAFVKQQLSAGGSAIPKMPDIDFSQFGAVEIQPLSKINKYSGKNLHRNWLNIPHVTQFDHADITEMEAFRQSEKAKAEQQGFKLTPLVFIMKAVVACLQAFPKFNASLDAHGENLILKKYFHIGVAADTPNGLVVPVIRDVDQKSLFDLAKELGEVSQKARLQGLTPKEMQGSCFTISSLGGIGGTAFTPIVNAPDVAILGISKSSMQPIYQAGTFVPRLLLPLSLSYDHRVIDGAEGARFCQHLVTVLADIHKICYQKEGKDG
jgi:pyruvate dehydrogenase E2 component (dihydrolipoamide acetyltransferase)